MWPNPWDSDGVFLTGTIACRSQPTDAVQNQLVVVRLRHGGTLLAQITSLFGRFCHGTREHHIDIGKVGPRIQVASANPFPC
jgi:hypothetical protein